VGLPCHIRIVALFAVAPLILRQLIHRREPSILPRESTGAWGRFDFQPRQVIGVAFAPDGSILPRAAADSKSGLEHWPRGGKHNCWERNQPEVNRSRLSPSRCKTLRQAEIGAASAAARHEDRTRSRAWDLLALDWARESFSFSTTARCGRTDQGKPRCRGRHRRMGKEVAPPGAPFLKPTLRACSEWTPCISPD